MTVPVGGAGAAGRCEAFMPAANRSELLEVTQKEWAKLQKVLAELPEDLRLEQDADETSPKDIVGHRAHWIELFLGWYRDGLAGKDVHFPAKGYKWNETKRYNADLRARQSNVSWPDACAMLEANHAELLELVEALTDAELYGAAMKGANNNWTTGRWAEAAGPSHYRSAAKYLRQRMRQAKAG